MCLYFIKFLAETFVTPARSALLTYNLEQLNRSKFEELDNFIKCFSGLRKTKQYTKGFITLTHNEQKLSHRSLKRPYCTHRAAINHDYEI